MGQRKQKHKAWKDPAKRKERKHESIGDFANESKAKTYNSEDSLVVTHPTTNSPACGLSTAERTGSPVFHTLWSYVQSYV
ncbi:hypothetical protein ACN38_g12754 [Penicillium nordicum]|uniref:Uncharacterized protein n=1 Tax=Penicillium nordicum TaxID=229535 RepID=A0A0M9W9S1_9EURO|nr:hypothetical protein ACN38_g12754 [Penicillium nordicum]